MKKKKEWGEWAIEEKKNAEDIQNVLQHCKRDGLRARDGAMVGKP